MKKKGVRVVEGKDAGGCHHSPIRVLPHTVIVQCTVSIVCFIRLHPPASLGISLGVELREEIPWNLFSPKAPYEGSCVSKETITSKTPLVNWETCHVIMDHGGKVPYIEGQSIGVIAPGPDKKGETPAKIRLYSIASSAPGDDESSKTVSLVVKRVVEVAGRGWCEYSNVEKGKDLEFPDAEKVYRGVCSSHICDLEAGDDVLITGPTGAEMLLPEDPEANMIFMATGTGIAPFRSHLRNLFHDKVSKGKFKGCAWLFLGVPYSESLLYDEEWKEMQAEFPGQFRYDYAVSSEEKSEKNKINGEMWVQHKMMEYGEDLWQLVKDSAAEVVRKTKHIPELARKSSQVVTVTGSQNARLHVRPQGHGEWLRGVFPGASCKVASKSV